ncbi:MAG: hypothetical protein WAT70_09690 [Rhizobiaceae bacterium]
MRRLVAIAAALMASAAVAGGYVPDTVQPGSPEWLMVERMAGPAADAAARRVFSFDFDEDDIPEFMVDDGAQTRIMTLSDGHWTDIAGPDLAVTRAETIAIGGLAFNGIHELLVGELVYAVAEESFRRKESIAPSPLDPAAYVQPCSTDKTIIEQIEFYGSDASRAAPYCSCLQRQVAARGLAQPLYDYLIPRKFDPSGRPDASEISDDDYDRVFAVQFEAEVACEAEFGWAGDREVKTTSSLFNGRPLPQGGADFFATCTGQDWIRANSRIGTPDRALAYCGCVANGLSQTGMNAEGFRLSSAFMQGDMSENEVAEIDPGVIDAGDQASETCIRALGDSDYCPDDRPHVVSPACVGAYDPEQ